MLRKGGSRGDGEAPTHEPITLQDQARVILGAGKKAKAVGFGRRPFVVLIPSWGRFEGVDK